MYVVEKIKPFYSSLSNLALTYKFPTKYDKSHLMLFYVKFTIVQMMCILFFCAGPFLHLVMTLKDETGLNISEDISVIVGSAGAITTCFSFTLRYKEWSQLFNDLTDFSKFGKPADFDAVAKRGNLLSAIYFWYANIGIIIYGAASVVEASYCKRLKEDNGPLETCGTMVPIWVPFEPGQFVLIIFIAQILVAYGFISPAAEVNLLSWEASEVLISHINHFKVTFSEIFEESTLQGRIERLRFSIQYHNHILRMCNQLNNLVRLTVGHMSLISAVVFGCIENQILKAKPIGGAIYLIGYVVALFWVCHAGQRIKDETLSISDVLYEAEWYKMEVRILKDLKFMLARSQKAECFDAVPLGAYNYALFFTIIKTSYSYLTLLKQNM